MIKKFWSDRQNSRLLSGVFPVNTQTKLDTWSGGIRRIKKRSSCVKKRWTDEAAEATNRKQSSRE